MRAQSAALLDKAAENLRAAQDLIRGQHSEVAVSRAYYAMFYAAEAVLLEQGVEFSSHGGVHGAFGEHFAKTGRIDPKFHRYLIDGFRARQSVDYDAPADMTREDAETLLQRAREFVLAIQHLMNATS